MKAKSLPIDMQKYYSSVDGSTSARFRRSPRQCHRHHAASWPTSLSGAVSGP
jgi:hypothetical protein